MSPSPEPEVRDERSAGFTLIEVMVALGIFLVVAAAVAPLVVAGLRSAGVARDITQSKGVAQARIEQMRDLPFYVGRSAGDYLDVLDTYYRNRTAPTATPSCASTTLTALPPTDWSGYVGAAGTHCVWEPPGQLYRKVVNPVAAPGLGVFSMVISTQFLSSATPPVAVRPSDNYDSQVAGKDAPPASQIGVTVAVFYKSPSGVHYTVTYSQIEQATAIAPLAKSEAQSSTIRASSALNTDTNLLEQLGVINLSGELYTGSRVLTTAAAATAGDSLGQQITGARANLVAPVDQTATSSTVDPVTYPTTGCDYQCFGKTTVDQASALASNGLPRAGSPTAPVRAMIPDGANNDGFRFSNGKNGTRLQLDASKPMVSLDTSVSGSMNTVSNCAVSAAASVASYLTGTGFLDATSTTVSSCATAQSNTVRLLPTSFAPKGVVQIVLTSATASCAVSTATSPSAAAAYSATVRWKRPGDQNTYSPWLSVSGTQPTDALAAVDLTQTVDDSGLKLGDYISSWKSLKNTDLKTATAVKTATTPRSAEASVPGAISIITQQTREDVAGGEGPRLVDPTSVISLTVGAVSCKVSDNR